MESISYITCTNNFEILDNCLLKSIKFDWEDEIIVIESPKSIAEGYNTAIDHAKHKIKCFIHHDIIITNPEMLRKNIMSYCTQDVGIVGVIGSKQETIPWWNDGDIGSVVDTRMGIIWFDEGKNYCKTLDGIVLATCQDVRFDESIPGFHLYDQDICKQMTNQGLQNFCMGNGYRMLTHFTSGTVMTDQINGYNEALDVYRKKWSC